jgi:phosphate-selective porin OprO/OprP
MKTKHYFLSFLFFFSLATGAQTSDEVLNLLIQKGLIGQNEADSLRAEYAIKQQEVKEKQKLFTINSSRPVQFSGYTQVRFQSLQEAGKPDGFDIRRARFDIRGSLNPYWEYRLQTDLAVSPKILDAYVGFKPFDFLKITAGQFYIPLTLESTTADNKLELIDRSQVVGALAGRDRDVIGNQNGRDLGLQLSGSFIKVKDRFLLDYYAGYFNGAGINTTDNNESKDVGGRLVIHPFKFIDIGTSYYNGFAQFGSPVKGRDRIRFGGELSFTLKGWSVKGEYIKGQDGTVKINGEDQKLNKTGWYVQTSYFISSKKFQAVLRYDTFDPNTYKAPETAPQNDMTTYYTVGLNYYFTEWARLQFNYTYRQEEGTQLNNDAITAQFQIGF